MTSAEQTVREFCAAWSTKDPDLLAGYMAENAFFHNVPREPVTGRAALRDFFAAWFATVDPVEFRILRLASSGNVVLTEREDILRTPAGETRLPIMGAFEVRDGKIVAWRDDADRAQMKAWYEQG